MVKIDRDISHLIKDSAARKKILRDEINSIIDLLTQIENDFMSILNVINAHAQEDFNGANRATKLVSLRNELTESYKFWGSVAKLNHPIFDPGNPATTIEADSLLRIGKFAEQVQNKILELKNIVSDPDPRKNIDKVNLLMMFKRLVRIVYDNLGKYLTAYNSREINAKVSAIKSKVA